MFTQKNYWIFSLKPVEQNRLNEICAPVLRLICNYVLPSQNSYTTFDNSPANGVNYYRLAQKDNDGGLAELANGMVSSSMAADEVKAWANPTDKLLGLSFSAGKYYRLKLVDANGKTLLTKMITNTQNNTKLDLSNYAKGGYIVDFMGLSGNKHQDLKIVKPQWGH